MKAWVTLALLLALNSAARADDFPRLDEALPRTIDIRSTHPVFDFDTDGCLPSAGIARDGRQNARRPQDATRNVKPEVGKGVSL